MSTIETVQSTTDTEPGAWIGCLACYNDGWLVGEWHYGSEAIAEFQPAPDCRALGHDEFWVMDHENLGNVGECSPLEAAQRAEAVERLMRSADDHNVPAHIALAYVEDSNAPVDCWPDIESAFSFDSFADFAAEMMSEVYGLPELPSWLQVDLEASGRELLAHDYSLFMDATTGTYYAIPA